MGGGGGQRLASKIGKLVIIESDGNHIIFNGEGGKLVFYKFTLSEFTNL